MKASTYPYQDPHAELARGMLLEQAIGREVRRQREKLDVTISELAKAAGISAGMLSKIESGATSASLLLAAGVGNCPAGAADHFLSRLRRDAHRHFSTAFYHLIIPSSPIIALYQLHFAGFGAIPGHVGFHQIEVGKNGLVDSHAYEHHLHHKYFEVNY